MVDPQYNRLHFKIHDYFIAKSIDKLRTGGIIAFIITSGTLDKKSEDRRGFDRSCYYADLQAHTCLLDGFVNQVRKFEKAKAQPAQDTPER